MESGTIEHHFVHIRPLLSCLRSHIWLFHRWSITQFPNSSTISVPTLNKGCCTLIEVPENVSQFTTSNDPSRSEPLKAFSFTPLFMSQSWWVVIGSSRRSTQIRLCFPVVPWRFFAKWSSIARLGGRTIACVMIKTLVIATVCTDIFCDFSYWALICRTTLGIYWPLWQFHIFCQHGNPNIWEKRTHLLLGHTSKKSDVMHIPSRLSALLFCIDRPVGIPNLFKVPPEKTNLPLTRSQVKTCYQQCNSLQTKIIIKTFRHCEFLWYLQTWKHDHTLIKILGITRRHQSWLSLRHFKPLERQNLFKLGTTHLHLHQLWSRGGAKWERFHLLFVVGELGFGSNGVSRGHV